MHIAAARHVPVVAIFGSTVPEFGFTPFRIPYEIVQKELSCRPCTHYGKAACPRKHFNCMNLIEVNEVAKAAEKLLN
jgi:heptosyltransferase-2